MPVHKEYVHACHILQKKQEFKLSVTQRVLCFRLFYKARRAFSFAMARRAFSFERERWAVSSSARCRMNPTLLYESTVVV